MEHGDFAAALSYRVPEYNPSALSNPKGTNRGDPTNNDWYFFGGVTISVNIGNASEFK